MAITFPLASPRQFDLGSVSWQPRENTARARNPFTLALMTQVFGGQMWQGSITITPQNEAEGRRLSAWLTALRRPGANAGTFLFEGPTRPVPLGAAALSPGTPIVRTAGQTGESLDVSGGPASTADYLKAGDFIQLGSGATARLHMVLEDCSVDSQTYATLSLWPGIRVAPPLGAPVTVIGAQGVFIASPAGWDVAPAHFPSVTLDISEVVP